MDCIKSHLVRQLLTLIQDAWTHEHKKKIHTLKWCLSITHYSPFMPYYWHKHTTQSTFKQVGLLCIIQSFIAFI